MKKKILLVALAFFAAAAEAGNGGRQRMFVPNASVSSAGQATTGNVTFYVDATGSDSGPCTGTGTNACATYQGAFKKIPKNIRHLATIVPVAGNYAGYRVSGFTFDSSWTAAAPVGILVDCPTPINVTPTTGSASGTATAGSAGSTTTYGTLTDSTATWTTNDVALVGQLLFIDTGTGSGQVKVITQNTATALTIAGTWTAPVAGSTYSIRKPTAIVTSAAPAIQSPTGLAVLSAGIVLEDNNMGAIGTASSTTGGNITLRNCGMSVAGLQTILVSGNTNLNLIQNTILGTTTGGITASNGARLAALASSVIMSTTGSAGAVTGASVIFNNSYLFGGVTASGSLGSGATTITSSQVAVSGSGGTCAFASFGGQMSVSSMRCNCNSAGSSSAVNAGNGNASGATAPQIPAIGITVNTALDVTNCRYGIVASSNSQVGFALGSATFTGNALTYGVSASNGANVILPNTMTITGPDAGVADLVIDEAAPDPGVSSYGSLTGITSGISNPETGSRVTRL